MILPVPRHDYFDIVASKCDSEYRIAKVKFARDGSVYVFFPGFKQTDGVVCRARLPGNSNARTNVDFSENGRITTHLVKYAHHPDGEAHFSQDGKVKTEIRRKSVPLDKQRGHLFSIQIQKIENFQKASSSSKGRLTLKLSESIDALKIVAFRYHISDFEIPKGISPGALPSGIQLPDGTCRIGLFAAPNLGEFFDDVVLFFTVKHTRWLSEEKKPLLLFLGGFDHTEVATNHSVDTEFLAFSYPCEDIEQLKRRINSIDLNTP